MVLFAPKYTKFSSKQEKLQQENKGQTTQHNTVQDKRQTGKRVYALKVQI